MTEHDWVSLNSRLDVIQGHLITIGGRVEKIEAVIMEGLKEFSEEYDKKNGPVTNPYEISEQDLEIMLEEQEIDDTELQDDILFKEIDGDLEYDDLEDWMFTDLNEEAS